MSWLKIHKIIFDKYKTLPKYVFRLMEYSSTIQKRDDYRLLYNIILS